MTCAPSWTPLGKASGDNGVLQGCAMSALFAATYPERVPKLLLFGGFAVPTMLLDDIQKVVAEQVKLWGTGVLIKTCVEPSRQPGSGRADCKI